MLRPPYRTVGLLRGGGQAILKVLAEPASFDFEKTRLNDVAKQLQTQYRVPVVIDKKALDDQGTTTDTLVTSRMSGIPLWSALHLMLRELNLTWTIAFDVLLITTPNEVNQYLVVRTYDVADLLVPLCDFTYRTSLPTMDDPHDPQVNTFSGSPLMPRGIIGDDYRPASKTPWEWTPRQAGTHRDVDFDQLIDLITSIVEPSAWDQAGGAGSIQKSDTMVVVSQSLPIHWQIESLLDALRAKKQVSPTVLVELKWLWLDAKQHEQLAGGGKPAAGGKRSLAVDAKALEQLARTTPGFRGQIACSNGQWVHLASGDRRSVIVSSIPVIGSGVGYQPVIQVPNVGVVVELRPSVAPGGTTAMLDVQSTVTRWAKPQPPLLQVGGSWPPFTVKEGDSPVIADKKTGTVPQPAPPVGPQETTQEPSGSASSPVERPQMPAQQLATTLRVPLGKPVIVGAMTFAPEGDAGLDKAGDNPRQLYLIATTSVVSEE